MWNLPRPSPSPKITLAAINNGKYDAQSGVAIVDTDHKNTAKHKTFFPPYLLPALAHKT